MEVVDTNQSQQRVGRCASPAHQAGRSWAEGEQEGNDTESSGVTKGLDEAGLTARLDAGLQVELLELLLGQGDRDLSTELMTAGVAIGVLVGGVLIGGDFGFLGSHLVLWLSVEEGEM